MKAVILVVLALLVVASSGIKLRETKAETLIPHKEHVERAFQAAGALLKLHGKATNKNGLGELTIQCALCGIVVNEIEGFVAENISLTTIVDTIEKDVCAYLPLSKDCDDLVSMIPQIVSLIEAKNTPSVVCVNVGYCSVPFQHQKDPSNVPTYNINLDSAPADRFTQICSIPAYQQAGLFLTSVLQELLTTDIYNDVGDLGYLLNSQYFPADRGSEIDGCAKAMGIPTGWLALFNIGYEVSDACTSIVAQTTSNEILHARNMDFWAGMGFTDTLKNITFTANFQRNGKTIYQSTQFAGYVGILSGMKRGAFSITINTRFYPQGPVDFFYEIVAAIMENNASLVSFLSRAVFENENNYPSAINALSNDLLIADVYYTVAGVSAGQGAVISRNRVNATNVWQLNASNGTWYLVQTNYDHWQQPPWFDNRVTPAENGMNALTRAKVSLGGMLGVLSIKPVLNIQTTFSTLMSPLDGTFKSYTRWCPYPCVE